MKNYSILAFIAFLITVKSYGQQTILWSVKKTDNAHTSYLLGTFHQIGNSFIDSIPEITKFIRTADIVIFESLATGQDFANILNKRKEDSTYSQYLFKQDAETLHRIYAGRRVPVSKLSAAELIISL